MQIASTEIGGQPQDAFLGIDQARHADTDTEQRDIGLFGVSPGLFDQMSTGVEIGIDGLVGRNVEPFAPQDRAQHIGQNGVDMADADFDPRNTTAAGVELQRNTGATDLVGLAFGFVDQPVFQQFGHNARDCAAVEADAFGEVGARERRVESQLVEDKRRVALADEPLIGFSGFCHDQTTVYCTGSVCRFASESLRCFCFQSL